MSIRRAAGRLGNKRTRPGAWRPGAQTQGEPMKYLCLICAETWMEKMPEAQAREHFEEYREFTEDLRRTRPLRRRQPATAPRYRDHGPRPEWQRLDHGRAVRGDQGTVRWLLRHRDTGPERGDPVGVADSGCTLRLRRSAPDRGGLADRRSAGVGLNRPTSFAAFAASDRASAMTAAIANAERRSLVD